MLRAYLGMTCILAFFKVKEELEINDRFRSAVKDNPRVPPVYDMIKLAFMICCPFINILFATGLLIIMYNQAAWNEVIDKIIEDRKQDK